MNCTELCPKTDWNIRVGNHGYVLIFSHDWYILEDRCTLDVAISKFHPLCFITAKSFENLDNILSDWAKNGAKKYRGIKQVREAGRRKITRAVSVGNRVRLSKPNTNLVLKSLECKKPLLGLVFNKPNKQNVYLIDWLIEQIQLFPS